MTSPSGSGWEQPGQPGGQPYGPAQPPPPHGYQQAPPPGYGPLPGYGPPPGYGPAMPPGYGYPIVMAYPPHAPSTNGLSVAGFVTGLCGLVLFWVPVLGVIVAATGVTLSAVGLAQGKANGRPTGLAIAGLVLGILGVLAFFLIMVSVLSS